MNANQVIMNMMNQRQRQPQAHPSQQVQPQIQPAAPIENVGATGFSGIDTINPMSGNPMARQQAIFEGVLSKYRTNNQQQGGTMGGVQ